MRFLLAALCGFLGAVVTGAAADGDRPVMVPAADVAIAYAYHPAGAGAEASIRVSWLVEEGKIRVDSDRQHPGYTLLDERAKQFAVVNTADHLVVKGPFARIVMPLGGLFPAEARFTRAKEDRVGGIDCADWHVEAQHETMVACVSADGLILRVRGMEGPGAGDVAEAREVSVGPLDPAQFRIPADYRVAQGPEPARIGPQAAPMHMDVCPTTFEGVPQTAPLIACTCPPEASKTPASVYGSNPYYWQSGVCRAAVQAGAIGADGGRITIVPASAPFFPGVTRNGVSSRGWGADKGFRVLVPNSQPAAVSSAPVSRETTVDVCPDTYDGFPESAPPLTCTCPTEATRAGPVYGANPYYWQSSVCRAAVNAGAIGAAGGRITIAPEAAAMFPGVTRNGIRSNAWGKDRGFRVVGAPAGATPVTNDTKQMTLDVCPNTYEGFPADAPTLSCLCPPEPANGWDGPIYGSNPYYWQSSVCHAAAHAGVIGRGGGQVVVAPQSAPFFPGTTKNGQRSTAWGSAELGFHVAAPPNAVPPAAGPVQAPIAASLRSTGKVQVYVHFVTDSAKLEPSSDPVLHELLDALQSNPAMHIALIGHTDAQGSAAHNQDLSERRAASLFLWLVQHGIDHDRLRSFGRGMREPIADNATEEGRALNRRVEVSVVN